MVLESKVSLDRICKFLLLEEVVITNSDTSEDALGDASGVEALPGVVEVVEVAARWSANVDTLVGITLRLNPGELVAITGEVGAGKVSCGMSLRLLKMVSKHRRIFSN